MVRVFMLALAAACCLTYSAAGAQDTSYGKQVFFEKGQCNQCHGWSGNGQGDDPRESGANLRASKLDRAQIVETISCGRPGTAMPHFDKFAYTDTRCYGATAADLGDQVPPIPPSSYLAKHDIEAVSDYLLANVIGKGEVTYQDCTDQFGEGASACDQYKQDH